MSDDNKVVALRQPDAVDDPLTAELRAGARHQRCCFHKTANILNKAPKSVQPAINAVFTPSAAELNAARNLIAAYEQALAQGLAAYAGPDGRAVTIHQYDQAKALLQTFR